MMKIPFLGAVGKKARISRDEFDKAFMLCSMYRDLVESPAWQELMKIAERQIKTRVEMIIQPEVDPADGLQKQLMRGERAGIALLLRTPHAIIEDAEFTMELYRSQEKLDEDFEEDDEPASENGVAPGNSSGTIGGFRHSP